MAFELVSSLPYVTRELPRCGGVMKAFPTDFEVEEVPAYEPCGEGEHLFVWIEKRCVSADELMRHVATTLGVPSGEVGCAGLKDKQAVTRQYVSVPAYCEAQLSLLNTDRVSVLKSARHTNKLKTGHLRGNRFRVVLREVSDDALAPARAVADRLRQTGVPNFYGDQRFGIDGSTPRLGLALIRGEQAPEMARVPRPRRAFMRRLAVSSVQSALFNNYLAGRMADGLLHRVVEGEVMQVCASGGPFWAEDMAREQARFDAHQIVPAGPMFGPKMKPCRGTAAEREAAILRDAGLDMAQFAAYGKLLRGTRRPNLLWVDDLEVDRFSVDGLTGLEFRFSLPPGSYATVVMREFTKPE